jgi:Protein of unknown function (DUF2971)
MRVYKFLDEKYALENLEKKRLKISFLDDLNDPFELLAFESIESDVNRVQINTSATLAKDKGVLCFSRSWDNPVLWSHYGDKHKGIALGFEIRDPPDGPPLWLEVSYVSKRLKCSPAELKNWNVEEARKLLTTKFEHWSYEDEVRIFASIEEKNEQGLCFYSFCESLKLVEVVLGVRCKKSVSDIHKMIGNDSPAVTVIQSKLDESSFSVVQKIG